MLRRKLTSAFLLSAFLLPTAGMAQTNAATAPVTTKAATTPAAVNIYNAPKETIDVTAPVPDRFGLWLDHL